MLSVSACFLCLWVVCVLGVSRPPMITRQPDFNVYYKPGETVQLLCEGNGEPWPTFSWTRNKEEFNPSGNDARVTQLPNSGTLVFNSPEKKDEGIYQCYAINDFGTAITINVNMRAAIMKKFSTAASITHTPILGMPLTLGCVPPESIPPAQVFWIVRDELGGMESISYDARVTMDREYRLRFLNVIEEDQRDNRPYACMAVNNKMRENAQGPQHFIQVRGNTAGFQPAKYMWSDQDDRFGKRGTTFTVMCIFSGYPTPDVHWDRSGNKTLPSRAKFKRFSMMLEIDDLQYEDAGSYECWANNDASGGQRVTRTFNIRVDGAPIFQQEPQSVETGVGATAQFHCRANGAPPPNIRWFVNGVKLSESTDKRLTSNRFMTIGENTVQMNRVEQTDFMVFQCNASNSHGYVFANAYLNVLSEAPEIIVPPLSLKVSAEGVAISLTCRTTGKPDPIVTWFKDGAQVSGGRYQVLNSGDLHIERVVLADAGHYTCEARNKFNTTSRDGSLVVRRKTRIEQKPGDLERNAGMDAKFTCSGTTDIEEVHNLEIQWLKDGKQITANDQRMMTNFQDNSLTISGTITRDSGTYTCLATNGLDSTRASAVLTVKDKPDPPLNVHQYDCTSNVKIQWMPGSYNNAPVQYYVLEYNTEFNLNQWNFGMKVNSSVSKVVMELSPWVSYLFRVIAYNKIGPSDPSAPTKIPCVTTDARPEYNPRNLRTIGNQPNTLFIEWTPMPQIQHNAEGFKYILEILRIGDSADTAKRSITVEWPKNTYEENTGRVYQRYNISIRARNNINDAKGDPTTITGYSFESTPIITPTNFVMLSVTDTSADFQWDFDRREIGKVDTKIRGEFRGFKIQFWQENNQVLTIRESDVGSQIDANMTGNTFTATVNNMLPNTFMMARISVINNFYVGRPTESIKYKTKPGFPGPVDYFRVLNIGDTHVNLEWGIPKETRGNLEGYDISYQLVNGLDLGMMQDREPQIDDFSATSAYLSGLQPKKRYRVHIFARTQAGRGEGYFIEMVTAKAGTPIMPRFRVVDVGDHNINISWYVNAYSSSGSVVYAEYRKQDGAEWLRSSDEVVNTWKNIEYLEAGTDYEVRIKATNGKNSVSSSIAEVTTEGTAIASALVGNIGWFLGMLFSILLLIGLIILFVILYKRGLRFELYNNKPDNYAQNTSAAYSDTTRIDRGSEHFGAEPKGYNNDYYDDKEYQNYDYDHNRPPSYEGNNYQPPPPAGDYEDYGGKPARGYDDDYDSRYPSAPVAGDRDDNFDYRDDYNRTSGQDDYYNRPRDDYYGARDDYNGGRDEGNYNDRYDDGYDRDKDDYGRRGYDYESDDQPRRSTSSEAKNGHSSTVV